MDSSSSILLVNSLRNLRRAVLVELLAIPIIIVAVIVVMVALFFQLFTRGMNIDVLASSIMNMIIILGGLAIAILILYYIYMSKGWKGMCSERTEYCTVRTVFTYLMPIHIIFTILALIFISMGISQFIKELMPWLTKELSTEDIIKLFSKIAPLLTGAILLFIGAILGVIVEVFVFVGFYRISTLYNIDVLKVGAILKLITEFIGRGVGFIGAMQFASIGVAILYIVALILIYLGLGNSMKKAAEIGAAGGI
ncbi:MAG: hypothetical protein DRO15_00450 [Thermoprotei archaeon]|nr:MAG: hypothetical protein DRO15_00450 [Thermoprotei archaeon]